MGNDVPRLFSLNIAAWKMLAAIKVDTRWRLDFNMISLLGLPETRPESI